MTMVTLVYIQIVNCVRRKSMKLRVRTQDLEFFMDYSTS